MPDVRDLLSDAAGEPVAPLDLDAVLRRGARRTARRRALVVGVGVLPVLVGVLVVLGRGSSSPDHDELVPAGPGRASAPASARPVGPTRLPTVPAPAAPRATAAAVRDVGPGPFTFFTPSRGTTCLLRHDGTGASAECLVTGNTWSLPPKPSSCAFDYGLSVAFDASAGAALTCRSDTFYDPTAEVVPYGTTVRSGELSCQVARTGVTCVNTTTGARFSVSRAAYRLS